jgi:hypothetical protein
MRENYTKAHGHQVAVIIGGDTPVCHPQGVTLPAWNVKVILTPTKVVLLFEAREFELRVSKQALYCLSHVSSPGLLFSCTPMTILGVRDNILLPEKICKFQTVVGDY